MPLPRPGRLRSALFLAASLLLVPATVPAGPWIAVHVMEVDTGGCDDFPLLSCWSYETRGALQREYDVYVVAQGIPAGEGIAGARLGLDYHPGVEILGITSCAGAPEATPDWPASGSGAAFTFDAADCQRTDIDGHGARAVVAVFRIRAADAGMFRVVEHPTTGDAGVEGCGGADHPVDPADLGQAAFSPEAQAAGDNSCTRPAERTGPILHPRIAPHVIVAGIELVCGATLPAHSDSYTVRGQTGVTYDVYLIAHDHDSFASGMAGAAFGVEYDDGLEVLSWTTCTTLEFASDPWPGSGQGIVTTWSPTTQCQRNVAAHGVEAVLGVLTVQAHTNASLRITPRNYLPNPDLKLASCASAEVVLGPDDVGIVGFGDAASYNVCTGKREGGTVPVHPTTWGRIKVQFGDRSP